jgi:hypothetical protein
MSKDGSLGLKATLMDVSVSKRFNFNLCSLTRLLLLRNGWRIFKGDSTGIVVEKDSNQIAIDIVINTAKGAIFACRFIRSGVELADVGTEARTTMNISKAHGLLGHVNEESTRKTAKELGWVLTRGKLKPCLHCAKAKAKQKNVCKASETPKAEKPGERVYLDLSNVTEYREAITRSSSYMESIGEYC